jgi:glycerol-3-phosphate acyltransferase PlsY
MPTGGMGALAVAALLGTWLAGFLLGSIPFGQIFARLQGIDLQKVGSGNIGATNAARALGKPIGVLVLLLDAGKAAGPMLAVRWSCGGSQATRWVMVAIGLGAVMGHMFTPWLRFKGGKGVATGFGAFLVLSPPAAGIAAAVWVMLYAVTRTSSVGSLVAVSAMPLLLWLFHATTPDITLACALVPLIVVKHSGNIKRLLRREESKV